MDDKNADLAQNCCSSSDEEVRPRLEQEIRLHLEMKARGRAVEPRGADAHSGIRKRAILLREISRDTWGWAGWKTLGAGSALRKSGVSAADPVHGGLPVLTRGTGGGGEHERLQRGENTYARLLPYPESETAGWQMWSTNP